MVIASAMAGPIPDASMMRSAPPFSMNLALMPAVTLPSGGSRAYFGEAGAVFSPEVLLSRDLDHLRVGLNLGTAIRPRSQALGEVVESELTGHLGAGYRFHGSGGGLPLELDASLSGAVHFVSMPLGPLTWPATRQPRDCKYGIRTPSLPSSAVNASDN